MGAVFSNSQRTEMTPRGGNESTFAFLERVAGPFWDRVRSLIEDMVSRLCPPAVPDVVGRLQSGDDNNFRGAVWELLVHETLLHLGFTVTCHPPLPGTTTHPDFLAENDECSFYVEAKILGEDRVDAVRDLRRSGVFAEVNNRVASDAFWLRVEVDEDGNQRPPVGRLARDVQQWLDRLDPTEVQRQYDEGGVFGVDGYTWRDDTSGWQLTFFPSAKRSHADGDRVLATMGGEARMIDDRGAIRTAVAGKASKYGTALDRPLVLALGLFRVFADDTDIMDALYGDSLVLFDPGTGDTTWERKPNGVWVGPQGRRRQQLSAVITCDRPEPSNAARLLPELWLNPWADRPLPCEPTELATRKLHENGAVEKEEARGALRDLLALPEDWPGPEPPYPRRARRPIDDSSDPDR